LGITALKKIAKDLKIPGLSGKTSKDIEEVRRRIEEEQDKKFGREKIESDNEEQEPVVQEQLAVEPPVVADEPKVVEPVVKPSQEQRPEKTRHVQPQPVEEEHKDYPCDRDMACNGDDVCHIHANGKGGECRSSDHDVKHPFIRSSYNGHPIIGTKDSIALLHKKLGKERKIEAKNDEGHVTKILRELGDSPDDLQVLNDPKIKNLIMCLFKK
jgi:hypothetical protein